MTHWEKSCFCNRLLLGDKNEPVCSRVYRQRSAMWRSVFLILMNWWFEETQHCRKIHLRWRIKRTR